MQEIEKIINWFNEKKSKGVTYSMINRYGVNNSNGIESYDCSSSIYYACLSAFNRADDWVRSTSTLPNFLKELGFVQIAFNISNIVIWQEILGKSGASAHTGIFTDNSHIIHCNYKNNGITEDTEDSLMYLYNRNWIVFRLSVKSGWVEDNGKWWYNNSDGTTFKNEWKFINGNWFYFDNDGYALKNEWKKCNDNWYYFDNDCYMMSNSFVTIGDETFYLKSNGVCAENEIININNKDYVFNSRGALITSKKINKYGYIE